ncbi:hypothetical protein Tco_1088215, partial [Tanacetum coccineum]
HVLMIPNENANCHIDDFTKSLDLDGSFFMDRHISVVAGAFEGARGGGQA